MHVLRNDLVSTKDIEFNTLLSSLLLGAAVSFIIISIRSGTEAERVSLRGIIKWLGRDGVNSGIAPRRAHKVKFIVSLAECGGARKMLKRTYEASERRTRYGVMASHGTTHRSTCKRIHPTTSSSVAVLIRLNIPHYQVSTRYCDSRRRRGDAALVRHVATVTSGYRCNIVNETSMISRIRLFSSVCSYIGCIIMPLN